MLGKFLQQPGSFPSHFSSLLPPSVSAPPNLALPLRPPRLEPRHQAGAGAGVPGAKTRLLLLPCQLEDDRSQLPLGVGLQLGRRLQTERREDDGLHLRVLLRQRRSEQEPRQSVQRVQAQVQVCGVWEELRHQQQPLQVQR